MRDSMKEVVPPSMTDEQYIICRNRLIPEAEKYASELHEEGSEGWSGCFLRKMDALAITAGLVRKGIY